MSGSTAHIAHWLFSGPGALGYTLLRPTTKIFLCSDQP